MSLSSALEEIILLSKDKVCEQWIKATCDQIQRTFDHELGDEANPSLPVDVPVDAPSVPDDI